MTLVRFDPFRNLIALQERMNRLFDESLHGGRSAEHFDGGTWMPPVDIYETEQEIVIVAELPGMDENDVEVEVREGVLTLKGERKMEDAVKKESYHRVERAYGGFSRSFTLPQSVDQSAISAAFAKGVLEVRMQKSRKATPRQIKIETK